MTALSSPAWPGIRRRVIGGAKVELDFEAHENP